MTSSVPIMALFQNRAADHFVNFLSNLKMPLVGKKSICCIEIVSIKTLAIDKDLKKLSFN